MDVKLHRFTRWLGRTAFAAALCLPLLLNAQVLAPISWDFGTDTGKDNMSDFTNNNAGAFNASLLPDALRLNRTSTSFQTYSYQAPVTNLGGTADFSISSITTLRITPGTNARFGLLANQGGASSGVTAVVYFTISGDPATNFPTLRFLGGNAGAPQLSGSSIVNLPEALRDTGLEDRELLLTLDGTWNGANLELVFTFETAGFDPVVNSFTWTNAPTDMGNRFGIGARSGVLRYDVDTLSVVPEPTVALLLGPALALLLLRRRRNA